MSGLDKAMLESHLDALAARVKELEGRLRAECDRADKSDSALRAACDEITRLHAMIRDANNTIEKKDKALMALESELAPIRALKVGSAEWAYYQMATGREVETNGHVMWCAADLRMHEPFALHQEPPPAPTGDDLCAAIEKVSGFLAGYSKDIPAMVAALELAAAYRAANAKGGV